MHFIVPLVVQNLPKVYVEKMLPFLAEMLDTSPHLQFYLQWCRAVLTTHGGELKNNASLLITSLRDLQKSIVQKQLELGKMYVAGGPGGYPIECLEGLWLSQC